MMQRRRREHDGSSSGELDVFGAASYFADLPPAPDDVDDCLSSVIEPSSTDRLYFQAKVVQRETTRMTEDNSFRGPPAQQKLAGLQDLTLQQIVATKPKRQLSASGKSKLAALLSFMVSPSPRASFRKENNKQEALSSTTRLLRQAAEAAPASAAGGKKETSANNTYDKQANSPSWSSRECSMQLRGLLGARDDEEEEELDLGVATGDRRLQGVTVVRGGGGDEERWVVRCLPGGPCWDDEDQHCEKMLDAAESASSEQNIKSDEMVEGDQLQGDDDDDGNIDPAHSHSWDSDSSSDLFDLDLEYR